MVAKCAVRNSPMRWAFWPLPLKDTDFPALKLCSLYVLILKMSRIDETAIATIILNAPGWARVGITVPDDRLRELARTIVEQLDAPLPEPYNPNQLALAL